MGNRSGGWNSAAAATAATLMSRLTRIFGLKKPGAEPGALAARDEATQRTEPSSTTVSAGAGMGAPDASPPSARARFLPRAIARARAGNSRGFRGSVPT